MKFLRRCLSLSASLACLATHLLHAAGTPDLAATTAPSVAPNPVTAGEIIHVNWTLRNVGSGDAAASRTLVRVVYPGGGLLFTTNVATPSIPAGGQVTKTTDIELPIESEAGNYRTFILADTDGDDPGDTNSGNDQSPNGFFTVIAAKIYCDLTVVGAPVVTPDPVGAGGKITVRYRIKNLGDAPTSGPSHVRIQIKSPIQTQITDAIFPVPALGPGGVSEQANEIQLPQQWQTGVYTAALRLDTLSELENEPETSNNFPDPVPFKMYATLPDLQLKFAEACPHTIHPGDTVRVNFIIRNESSVPAPVSRTRFVLDDAQFQRQLFTYVTNHVIAPGGEESFTVPFAIPSDTKLGSWRVAIFLNDFSDYTEANFFDNVFDPAIRFTVVAAGTAIEPCIEPIRIENPRQLNGAFAFDVVGPADATVPLRSSTDLKTWAAAGSVKLVNGRATVTSPPGAAARFHIAAP